MSTPTPNDIWRRGNRVPAWRYALERRVTNVLWPMLRRLWRGF